MGSPEIAYGSLPVQEKPVVDSLEAVNDSIYGHELERKALVEMGTILTSEKYDDLTLAERASLLRTLILERGASIGHTSKPVDNSQRFLVELLAKELSLVEKLEDEETLASELSRPKQVT